MFNNSTSNISVSTWNDQVFLTPEDCGLEGQSFIATGIGIGINGQLSADTTWTQVECLTQAL